MAGKLALVFSGGGARGAFGAGVLQEILDAYPTLTWQIVSGTSTGALIAPFAALAAMDLQFAHHLGDFYVKARQVDIVSSNVTVGRILKKILHGLLPTGLTSLTPLQKKIAANLSDEYMSHIRTGAVTTIITTASLQTGKLGLCTQDDRAPEIATWYARNETPGWGMVPNMIPYDNFRDTMVASCAVPFAADPITLTGEQCVDGGVLDIAPLRPAAAAGATDAIVVLTSPPPVAATTHYTNLFAAGLRAVVLLQDEQLRNDIARIQVAARLNSLRVVASQAAATVSLLEAVKLLPELRAYIRAGISIDPVLVQPVADLCDTMDFDSQVLTGWPESPTVGTPTSIMQARFDHGRRVVQAMLADSGSRLLGILTAYSR